MNRAEYLELKHRARRARWEYAKAYRAHGQYAEQTKSAASNAAYWDARVPKPREGYDLQAIRAKNRRHHVLSKIELRREERRLRAQAMDMIARIKAARSNTTTTTEGDRHG